ncbi:uncharacterized protein LOC144645173 [Oculina patagonica]
MKNPLCNELLLFQPTSTEVEDFNSCDSYRVASTIIERYAFLRDQVGHGFVKLLCQGKQTNQV